MNITRKEFLRQGILSLGEMVYSVADALSPLAAVKSEAAETNEPLEFVPVKRDELTAVAHNQHCLAANCGCFTCIETCEQQAIQLLVGRGIGIDRERCRGCGACEHLCPVTPKAVVLQPRPRVDQDDGQQPATEA